MTIPLDPRFIPAFSIEDVLLDKDTGAPLSGGLVYFEYDNQRGLLKPIYQITGTSPNYIFTQLPNPMTLSSIGTFMDALDNPVIPYFYPYAANGDVELYYIRVTNANDVPQFDREAQPYVFVQSEQEILSLITNEISNPQFIDVLFDTASGTYTYNVTGATDLEIPIAPDWDLVVSGTVGSVTLAQNTPEGTLNLVTNPGTLLTISSTGLTKLHLRQRMYGSPNLWGSGYIAGSFVAKTYNGTAVALNMYYSQSNGTIVDKLIVSGTLNASGAYGEFPGSSDLIPDSNSTQNYPDAYIDIYFDIPLSIQIDLTSVMVSFSGGTKISNIKYDQETQNRQVDHLFHYFKPQLAFKPIPSMLVGWDFPLNPAQFVGASLNITTTAAYTWDQTISKSGVGNIAVVRNAFTGGFQATTSNANEAFYLLQYLDGGEAREIVGNRLAVNINAFRTQAGGAVTCKVYLYAGRAASSFPTLPTSLGTINAAGEFTLTAANWTLIPRGAFGQASGTLSTVNTGDYTQLNDVEDLNFNGWELADSAQISDTNKFAIVVTFSCPTTATVVTIDSVGLMKGDIATRPGAQTLDEVFRECEYYWEKSWDNATFPVGVTNVGALIGNMTVSPVTGGAGVISSYATEFGFQMKIPKRITGATVTLYSPANITGGFVQSRIYNAGNFGASSNVAISNWASPSVGEKSVWYGLNGVAAIQTFNTGATAIGGATATIQYQYIVDARLGVV